MPYRPGNLISTLPIRRPRSLVPRDQHKCTPGKRSVIFCLAMSVFFDGLQSQTASTHAELALSVGARMPQNSEYCAGFATTSHLLIYGASHTQYEAERGHVCQESFRTGSEQLSLEALAYPPASGKAEGELKGL